MSSRKRKAGKSEEGSETTVNKHMKKSKDKELAWLEKQNLPCGSSPIVWDSKYTSSFDEEFEGFLHRDHLLLSDVDRSTPNTAVVNFFQGFNCTVVSKVVEKDKKVTFTVKFSPPESAVEALEKFKDVQLKGQTVSLTRSVDSQYKSFCIKGFNKNQNPNVIRQQLNQNFCVFGRIIHIFFPLKEEDFCYLYMALKPEFTANHVVAVKGLQVRECQMKGKVTKRLISKST